MAWNDLELPDKARMIKLAVDSGITDLRTIQEVYNKFAEGGHLYGLGDKIKKVFAKNYDTETFGEAFNTARSSDKEYFKWHGNVYNTKLDTEVFREEHPQNLSSGYALQDANARIHRVENSKNNPNGGWDKQQQVWRPHTSVEGGAPTIAYGLKLNEGTEAKALVDKQGYLTDEQAETLLAKKLVDFDNDSRRRFDKAHGEGAYDALSEKAKGIILDYAFNLGSIKSFPKLMTAFHEGDLEEIKKNYKRYTNKKSLARNREILKDIDSLGTFYPIHSTKIEK